MSTYRIPRRLDAEVILVRTQVGSLSPCLRTSAHNVAAAALYLGFAALGRAAVRECRRVDARRGGESGSVAGPYIAVAR